VYYPLEFCDYPDQLQPEGRKTRQRHSGRSKPSPGLYPKSGGGRRSTATSSGGWLRRLPRYLQSCQRPCVPTTAFLTAVATVTRTCSPGRAEEEGPPAGQTVG
jgi:hypothetical protein